MRIIDLTEHKFGLLTVMYPTGEISLNPVFGFVSATADRQKKLQSGGCEPEAFAPVDA